MPELFWERLYRELEGPSVFGKPSEEILTLATILPTGGHILDVGCGDGRHALYLLALGFTVTAIDISNSGIKKLVYCAGKFGSRLRAEVGDVQDFHTDERFDAIIAHGVLHFLAPPKRNAVIAQLQKQTVCGGYNVVAVFTDTVPAPPDQVHLMEGMFTEGELACLFKSWDVVLDKRYIRDDEHPGGIRHRHAINKIVARKPMHIADGAA